VLRLVGCDEWVWAPPRKELFFIPKNDDTVFNRQKRRTVTRSLGTRILLQNETDNNSAKIIQKFTVRPGGGAVAPSPPKYATGLHCSQLASTVVTKNDLPPEKQSHKS